MELGCVAVGSCLTWLAIAFAGCMWGPKDEAWDSSNTSETCLAYFDYDCDQDVDLADFAAFQNEAS